MNRVQELLCKIEEKNKPSLAEINMLKKQLKSIVKTEPIYIKTDNTGDWVIGFEEEMDANKIHKEFISISFVRYNKKEEVWELTLARGE